MINQPSYLEIYAEIKWKMLVDSLKQLLLSRSPMATVIGISISQRIISNIVTDDAQQFGDVKLDEGYGITIKLID